MTLEFYNPGMFTPLDLKAGLGQEYCTAFRGSNEVLEVLLKSRDGNSKQ